MKVVKELNIDLTNSDLTEDQNRPVFETNLSELGSTSVYKHRIDIVDDIPVTSRHYRVSKEIKYLIEKEIDAMLKQLNQVQQSGQVP